MRRTVRAYYNEFDPKAAAWLRELIRQGHIMEGEVDTRSIADVRPADLVGFTRCHFFAGIGGWDYALRLANWGDEPVWTGSCPCQPFSAAGKGEGFNDPRHLWPEFFRLIRESHPDTVVGEQVSGALAWLDLVSGDLEGEGYAVGSAIVGAHSVGAPHIRQRLYWVAQSCSEQWAGLPRGRGGLPPSLTVAMDSEQQGVPMPEHAAGEGVSAPPAGGGGGGANRGSYQPGHTRLSPQQPADCHPLTEQSQSPNGERGSLQAQGAQSLVGVSLDQSQVPMAWVVCDERGGDNGEDGGAVGGPTRGLAHPERDAGEPGRPAVGPGRGDATGSGWAHAEPGRSGDARGLDDSAGTRRNGAGQGPEGETWNEAWMRGPERGRPTRGLADALPAGRAEGGTGAGNGSAPSGGALGGLGHADQPGPQGRGERGDGTGERATGPAGVAGWTDLEWLPCRDGKARPTQPGIFPLAARVPGRVGLLRGYGNAIVPQAAAAFLEAYQEVRNHA